MRLTKGARGAVVAAVAVLLVVAASQTHEDSVSSRKCSSCREMEDAFGTDRVVQARKAALERALTDDGFFERYRAERNPSATFRPSDLRGRFVVTNALFLYHHERNSLVRLFTGKEDRSCADFAAYVRNAFDRLTAVALYDATTSDSERLRIALSFLPMMDEDDKQHVCKARTAVTEPLAGYLARTCGG